MRTFASAAEFFADRTSDGAARLARILGETGRPRRQMSGALKAEERYVELVARHPAAFAEVGGDPQRAVGLTKLNFDVRRTARVEALLSRAIETCAKVD